MENQRRYLTWLSKQLGRDEGVPSEWYSVTLNDFASNEGGR